MKCQHCEKPAVFHITELTGPEPQEVHLCEDHAQLFLAMPGSESEEAAPAAPSGKQKKLAKTAEDLSRVDQSTCPKCGITFHEFRQQGRLGCAHDYDHFQRELEPLLSNIHGEKVHCGKRPRTAGAEALVRAELNRLKEQMREAVDKEQYELASQLRDQIRKLDKDGTNS
ncbi:MAG: hypothetical protein RLY70_4513 [Planctomycetota bacterium]|jgi:protein arginine kinase activator